jgi:uncharacterized protein (TIRG00374 family)
VETSRRPRRTREPERGWKAVIPRPLRRGVVIFVIILIVEYLVVPELVGASKNLHLLGRINVLWVIAGVVLEGVSLFCYALLTRALLPSRGPGLFTLFRIDLAAAAVAHVIPAGTVGSAGIGYRLFTAEGISGTDAGVMMATKGLGSTVVLNALLWISLVVSIPLAGFRPIYLTVAIIGAVGLAAVAALALAVTRGERHARRLAYAAGEKIPGLTGERLENVIIQAAASLFALGRDRVVLRRTITWASLNWILDAASLWCFVAAFGAFANPFELFAAYGIANVAGVLPVTPAGLGVIDSVAPLLLVSFGMTRSVATLGVLGWRLVNFWLPIPAGALAYLSLKMPRGGGLAGIRKTLSDMVAGGSSLEDAAGAEGPRAWNAGLAVGNDEAMNGEPAGPAGDAGAGRPAGMARQRPGSMAQPAGLARQRSEGTAQQHPGGMASVSRGSPAAGAQPPPGADPVATAPGAGRPGGEPSPPASQPAGEPQAPPDGERAPAVTPRAEHGGSGPVQEAVQAAARVAERTGGLGEPGRPVDRRSPFFIGMAAAAGVAVTFGLVELVIRARAVLVIIGLAAFIAVGLDPVVAWLARRGVPRWVAVIAVVLAVLGVAAGFLAAAIPPLAKEATMLAHQLPHYLHALRNPHSQLGRLNARYRIEQRLTSLLTSRGGALVGGVLGAGELVLSTATAMLAVAVLSIYFLAGLPRIKLFAYRLVPHSRRPRTILITDEIMARVGGYVLGNVLTSVIAGVGTFAWMVGWGIPYPVLLGLFVALADLVPVIGSTVGGAIVTLVALTVSLPVAIATLGFYIAYRLAEDYLIVPRVMGHTVQVPAIVSLVAVLIGGALMGIIGALVAIPVAAALRLLLHEVTFPRLDRS